MKKIISVVKRIARNETVVAIYTIASLLLMMLIATSENIPLISVSIVNLWLAVRHLNKIEDKRIY